MSNEGGENEETERDTEGGWRGGEIWSGGGCLGVGGVWGVGTSPLNV